MMKMKQGKGEEAYEGKRGIGRDEINRGGEERDEGKLVRKQISSFSCHAHIRKGKGKGKAVTLLFLTEHHVMKAYWGAEE
jgi:hypothetical protein